MVYREFGTLPLGCIVNSVLHMACPVAVASVVCALSAQSGRAGEVIGATGRIGSLLLRTGAGSLAATPRGIAPGGLSPAGTPIIVATPAEALHEVLSSTPRHRVCDLCLLCNGMVTEMAADVLGAEAAAQVTAGVLYFGVLSPGATPTSGPGAPPTALAGPHAATVASNGRGRGG